MGGLEELLAGLDRAGAGDDDHVGASDGYAIHVHDGAVGLYLAADQFEGLGDRNDVINAWRDLQGLDFVAATAAHGGNDGALGAPGDMRLVAGFADAVDDVVDFCFGGLLGHVDDHRAGLPEFYFRQKNKSRDMHRGFD